MGIRLIPIDNPKKLPRMIVKEIVCEMLIAIHIILFIQSKREKYSER